MLQFNSLNLTENDIIKDIENTHGTNVSVASKTQFLLLYSIASVPYFSAQMFYEMYGLQLKLQILNTNLSRLTKRGFIKVFELDRGRDNMNNLYYITKAGYEYLSEFISANQEYQSKGGKKIGLTCMHDYGEGYSYFAYLHSPFSFKTKYEAVVARDAKYMPTGKGRLMSLRHDVVFSLYQNSSYICNSYIEHDTGSEQISIVADKLKLYADHGLTDQNDSNDILIITFRKSSHSRLDYFYPSKVKKLLPYMENGTGLRQLSEGAEMKEDTKFLADNLCLHFEKNGMGIEKEDVESYIERLSSFTEPTMFLYNAWQQEHFEEKRKVELLSYLYPYIQDHNNDYYSFFESCLSGFCVFTSSAVNLVNYLPYIHMEHCPDILQMYEGIFSFLLGDVSYKSNKVSYTNCVSGKHPISLRNIFYSDDYNKDIALEYISHDVGAFIRIYHILNGYYSPEAENLLIVMLVDSFDDALRYSSLLRYRYDIQEIRANGIFACFMNMNESELYLVSGKEEKVILHME